MRICIVTHVVHTKTDNKYFAYAPYVNEMNIWLKYVDEVDIVAALDNFSINSIHSYYNHRKIHFNQIKSFNFLTIKGIFKSFFAIFFDCYMLFKAMKKADHIHLRCPGNIGLLGCIIQILFPNKPKTAKYAGNWDPKAKQPLSYRFQKWILSNTFLTKNMKVLVYGEWGNQSENIMPFFTATYQESEKTALKSKSFEGLINFIFVGTLSKGKQPISAVMIVQELINNGVNAQLSIYGYGIENENLKYYIKSNNLENRIKLNGNIGRAELIDIYKKSHFIILPSKSEGWPKVIAEAMFWGCLPIATPVSCIPNMFNQGERGIILTENTEEDCRSILKIINNDKLYNEKINLAIHWSRNFTIDKFENEIKALLQK